MRCIMHKNYVLRFSAHSVHYAAVDRLACSSFYGIRSRDVPVVKFKTAARHLCHKRSVYLPVMGIYASARESEYLRLLPRYLVYFVISHGEVAQIVIDRRVYAGINVAVGVNAYCVPLARYSLKCIFVAVY